MADKKISQLDLAAQINNDAVIPMSQENGGEQTTYKALITALAAKIGEGTTFSNLNTNAKNLVGAINEIEAGGGGGGSSNANLAPDYDATSTYAVGDWCIYNGTLYQCNTAIPTAEAFDPTHWTAKKVVDAFADIEDELDDKVDTTDFLATNLPIQSGSATNTKDYIDTGLSGKADKTELVKYFDLTANVQTADSGISPFSYYAQPEKTDSNIHNILSVTVIDTNFNNPAIAVFYSVSGSTYKFMIYSARTGNVKIRVVYN